MRLDKLPDWIRQEDTLNVYKALEAAGGDPRFVGGCVRDAVLGVQARDVDLSTILKPEDSMYVLEEAGIMTVPTGIDFGTITAVTPIGGFEITSLRKDIRTDGRHAVVEFGVDWREDALRRDFTINAMYMNLDGEIFDYFGGLEDLKAGKVRFIGDAKTRIKEDYLRILRFFRFHARFGVGRPDDEGLESCQELLAGIDNLSGERIRKEMSALLELPKAAEAIGYMEESGVSAKILPEGVKHHAIDIIKEIEGVIGEGVGWLARLAAMLRPAIAENGAIWVADRWKLPKHEAEKLVSLQAKPKIDTEEPGSPINTKQARAYGKSLFLKLIIMEWAENLPNGAKYEAAYRYFRDWNAPEFPLKGVDLMGIGYESGQNLGKTLKKLEETWENSGYFMQKDDLLGLATRIKGDFK